MTDNIQDIASLVLALDEALKQNNDYNDAFGEEVKENTLRAILSISKDIHSANTLASRLSALLQRVQGGLSHLEGLETFVNGKHMDKDIDNNERFLKNIEKENELNEYKKYIGEIQKLDHSLDFMSKGSCQECIYSNDKGRPTKNELCLTCRKPLNSNFKASKISTEGEV